MISTRIHVTGDDGGIGIPRNIEWREGGRIKISQEDRFDSSDQAPLGNKAGFEIELPVNS